MARIRTIKPELAKHELLFDAEQETGLPLRFAWAMMFTVCDREGRFAWRPRTLKSDVLPYDVVDFSRVLDAWLTRGLIVKYRVDDAWFGCIPTFTKHQVVNNREKDSDIPSIEQADEVIDKNINENNDNDACPTRAPRVDDACLTPLENFQGEGKGRERKGKEGEGNILSSDSVERTQEKSAYPDLFENFWSSAQKIYRRVADPPGNKSEAFGEFQKLKPSEVVVNDWLEKLSAQADRKAEVQKLSGRHEQFKHVCRWLKYRGWESGLESIPDQTSTVLQGNIASAQAFLEG